MKLSGWMKQICWYFDGAPNRDTNQMNDIGEEIVDPSELHSAMVMGCSVAIGQHRFPAGRTIKWYGGTRSSAKPSPDPCANPTEVLTTGENHVHLNPDCPMNNHLAGTKEPGKLAAAQPT
jgi:hypothetical protein